MALFIINGRKQSEGSEGIRIMVPATVVNNDDINSVVTQNMSESGLTFYSPHLCDLTVDDKSEIKIIINSEKYEATLSGHITNAVRRSGKFIYDMKIDDYCGTYNQYLQILYDREPGFPLKYKRDGGFVQDMKLNIKKRINPDSFTELPY